MNTQPEQPQPQNHTLLAALYQVTARWYANDGQLIWRRITFFTTLNTGLLTAQVLAPHLQLVVRLILGVLGIGLSWYSFGLIGRTWRHQDFQAAVLRDQERAMNLDHLGVFSRIWAIRHPEHPAKVHIAGVDFLGFQLTGSIRNRRFMAILVCVFMFFHAALLLTALFGISLYVMPKP